MLFSVSNYDATVLLQSRWLSHKVAAAKQGMETALQAAIEDLTLRLEEMAIYKTVYPNPNLGALIARVYKGVIDFSRHATKYYKGHRICMLPTREINS